ncbi:helix-turn-helix domain-containing protein [Leclercia adecarboxylata]|uniref:helix-turn-helix domain-containing protein n=1 Tax=Leclercia adecarboxylata TaxID=83655 RepID=UPI0011DF1E41|nr:helix-turn-helix domain-containing protein [Leclercia adecarboxylata]
MPPKVKNHTKISLKLLLLPGFSLLSMSVFLEHLLSLQSSGDREKSLTFNWDLVAPDNEPVTSACGTQVKTSLTLESQEMVSGINHYLIIFGSRSGHDNEQPAFYLKPVIGKALKKRMVVAGMDHAAFHLAKTDFISEHTLAAFNAIRRSGEHYSSESIPVHTGVFTRGDIWLCTGGHAASKIAELIAQKRLERISEIKKFTTAKVMNDGEHNDARAHPSSLTTEVTSTLQFIKHNLSTRLEADAIASRFGLNRRTLDLLMTRETGRTVQQTIVYLRTDHACHLLLQKTKSLKEVAEECGFENINQFTRLFKKRTGSTPAAWRYEAYLHSSR